MKFSAFAAILACTALVACGSSQPSAPATAFAPAVAATGNGKPFTVRVAEDKTFAMVAPKTNDFTYTGNDARQAAAAATSCKTSMSGGVLDLLGIDVKTSDLQELQTKVSGFKGWRVDLAC